MDTAANTPDVEKKLFLLDAYALIYRAYYALIRSPRMTSKGMNTSAIFGFCNTLDDVINKEHPTHIAVCFDPKGGHTFRHEIYPEYKAQREAQPEDITIAVPIIKEIIDAYRIPIFEVPDYEADDVIGTISRKAEAEGFLTYMMTPDKDYGQLVTDSVRIYKPALRGKDFEIRGPKEVCDRYGISRPLQVIDLLALEGDSIDNIPGCPGIGPKTASKLIGEFGSVENLLENVDKVKGANQQRLRDNAEQVRWSKVLATIKTDVPLNIDFDRLRIEAPDTDRLRDIYKRLEFKSFLAKLSGSASPTALDTRSAALDAPGSSTPNPQPSLFDFIEDSHQAPDVESRTAPQPIDSTYRIASSADEQKRAVAEAIGSAAVGIQVCADGAEAMTATIRGLAVAPKPGVAYYLPYDASREQEWADIVRPLFAAGQTTIVGHDTKRDMILLRRLGIDFAAPYFDTSVAHYLLQPEMRHRLADVAFTLLGVATSDYGSDTRQRKGSSLSVEAECSMACEAADIALRLQPELKRLLGENGLERLMDEVETPLVAVLADMEWTGVRIDVGELAALSAQLTDRMNDIEEEIYQLAGTSFNIASPSQVGDILFDRLRLDPKAKRTKTGSYSTTEEILEKLRPNHPIVDLILKFRGLRKLLTTYINNLPTLINPATGKIHTTFNQTVTATGRISSTNPNLQNIPVRTDDGREIRRAFIADPGDLFMSADYSQIELRLMADLSADPDMVEAFLSGADIHQSTASKIFHEPMDQVTPDQRRKAKTANFGIIYGISAFGLSERLGIPRSEAKALIDGYFATYPTIAAYIEKSIADARERGYVSTIMGRKRYLPDINSRNSVVRSYAERNAVNAPLQGSAADIIKVAMVRIHREMKRLGMLSRMILQVHDELVFNVVPDELPALQALVEREMTGAYSGRIPMEVAAGVGQNWLEAH